MFCVNCGKEYSEGVSSCPHCGKPIGNGNDAVQQPINRSNDAVNKKKYIILWVISLAVALAVSITIILVFSSKDEVMTDHSSTEKNISDVVDGNIQRSRESKDLTLLDNALAAMNVAIANSGSQEEVESCLLIDASGNLVANELSPELKKAFEDAGMYTDYVFSSDAASGACIYVSISSSGGASPRISVYASNDGGESAVKPIYTEGQEEMRVSVD